MKHGYLLGLLDVTRRHHVRWSYPNFSTVQIRLAGQLQRRERNGNCVTQAEFQRSNRVINGSPDRVYMKIVTGLVVQWNRPPVGLRYVVWQV
jgi:hypothetical protein